MSDRRVHAEFPGSWAVVRYDRAGKWFLEGTGHREGQRGRISLHEAVVISCRPGWVVHFGLLGGQRFDAAVRAKREEASR